MIGGNRWLRSTTFSALSVVICGLLAASVGTACNGGRRNRPTRADAGERGPDAGFVVTEDGGFRRDAGHDGGHDAGFDAGQAELPDAGYDGGHDGGHDAGRPDAGFRADAGPPRTCAQGGPCTSVAECGTGDSCAREFATTLYDDPSDPVTGLPAPVSVVYWQGGYCTSVPFLEEGTAGACDPISDTGCTSCTTCVSLGPATVGGPDIVTCAERCTPSQTSNPCRAGYTCSLASHACIPGCSTDTECRVYRADTNGNGVYDPGIDRLVYDSASLATCNLTTRRCTHPAGGSVTGAACTRDAQCEADGVCISPMAWTGGYCSRFGCDTPGRECTGPGSRCLEVDGNPMCVVGCRVGAEPLGDRTGPAGHGAGCRAGYECAWDGASSTGVNGSCQPGIYNSSTAGVGAVCTRNNDCASPYGRGRCFLPEYSNPAREVGSCTVVECNAPGLESICGASSQCVAVNDALSLCLKNCTTAADCPTSYACRDHDASSVTPKVCFLECTTSADCGTGFTCRPAAGGAYSTCERL